MVKADVDSFDLSSRVSSFDSDVSSWSSIASDDSGSAPRSPQSSVDSMSDSSHSDDAEHLSPYTSSSLPSYPVQDHWVQPHFQRQATSILLKEEPQVTLTSSRLPHSPVPVLPLPFNPPVYAFNYHSAEDEPTPQPHSSRHERREGLRGGGDSRQELQRSYLQLQSQGESGLYSASAAVFTAGNDIVDGGGGGGQRRHLAQVAPPVTPHRRLLPPPLPALPSTLPALLALLFLVPLVLFGDVHPPQRTAGPQRGGGRHLHEGGARRQDRPVQGEARQPSVAQEDFVRLQEVVRGQPSEGGRPLHQDEARGGRGEGDTEEMKRRGFHSLCPAADGRHHIVRPDG